MTVSTLTVVPEASASGTAPYAEPLRPFLATLPSGISDASRQALARAAHPDHPVWLAHIRPAAGCVRPIRLAGTSLTIEAATGRLLSTMATADLPDGVIYKACGNRRASACPDCSKRYQRDAYQVIRTGLVGGKGVPDSVATHPAVFATFTAPSFGPVHTRVVRRHTCTSRRRCDCRPEPCRARRDLTTCGHGIRLACYARHPADDRRLGTPLCLDCYDHDAQVVWNLTCGELWRRTRIGIERHLRRTAKTRGIDPATINLSYGKAAEMQRRAVVHFHAIIRLDGVNPKRPGVILPPSPELDAVDLVDAVERAAAATEFTTPPHPAQPHGWPISWGVQLDLRIIAVAATGEVTDGMVAAYLAKYATKSTEITGHTSARLTDDTIDVYADPDGTHTERLVDACWMLGRPRPWRLLRRWAHMLGFGGHFLTKSRRYSVTFTFLRNQRITFRRTVLTGPETTDPTPDQDTTFVVSFLKFVGAGWHTTGDALLANASAARAREHNPFVHSAPTATAA